jgi:hypothetical protein
VTRDVLKLTIWKAIQPLGELTEIIDAMGWFMVMGDFHPGAEHTDGDFLTVLFRLTVNPCSLGSWVGGLDGGCHFISS